MVTSARSTCAGVAARLNCRISGRHSGRVRCGHRRAAQRRGRRVVRVPRGGNAHAGRPDVHQRARSSTTRPWCRSASTHPRRSPAKPVAATSSPGSVLLPPAATVYETPESIERRTASSSAAEAPPPNDMFATAGLTALLVTQSTPAITPAVVPEPLTVQHPHTPHRRALGDAVTWYLRRCRRRGCRGRCRPARSRRCRRCPSRCAHGHRSRCASREDRCRSRRCSRHAPVLVYSYVWSSGNARWSIRSRPQGGLSWMLLACTIRVTFHIGHVRVGLHATSAARRSAVR